NAEFLFGLRVADLEAIAREQQSSRTTRMSTFYSSVTLSSQTTSSSATWKSRFFGVGPRVGITGVVPIVGLWSFDYGAGAAELFGRRSFDVTVWNSAAPGFASAARSNVFVFNADAFLAISYSFTPNFKLSSGLRADYYNSVLTTYNINTGAFQN